MSIHWASDTWSSSTGPPLVSSRIEPVGRPDITGMGALSCSIRQLTRGKPPMTGPSPGWGEGGGVPPWGVSGAAGRTLVRRTPVRRTLVRGTSVRSRTSVRPPFRASPTWGTERSFVSNAWQPPACQHHPTQSTGQHPTTGPHDQWATVTFVRAHWPDPTQGRTPRNAQMRRAEMVSVVVGIVAHVPPHRVRSCS